MDTLHIGHWLGQPISDLSSIGSELLTAKFHVIEHGEDISILSNPDIQFCFFYLGSKINPAIFTSSLNICSNLNKYLIVLHETELVGEQAQHHAIYDSIDIDSRIDLSNPHRYLAAWINNIHSKVHLSFSSNIETLEQQTPSSKVTSTINQDLIHILHYMETHLAENIKEEDMAKRCHYSTTYFSKVFHRVIGISFRDYLGNKRINAAKDLLLRESTTSISTIAYQCGYRDVSYFSRIFKKKTGVSPGVFRQIQ